MDVEPKSADTLETLEEARKEIAAFVQEHAVAVMEKVRTFGERMDTSTLPDHIKGAIIRALILDLHRAQRSLDDVD